MDRKEFLASVGIGAAAVVYSMCLNGCKPMDEVTNPPTGVDFTLNLEDPANATLKTNSGFIVKDGIIVARTKTGTYVAVSVACTHQGTNVQDDGTSDRFHCPNHGSNFADDGSVINGPASSPLTKYNTALTGSSLRVTS